MIDKRPTTIRLVAVALAIAALPACAAEPFRTASVTESMAWGGLERTYRIHIPPGHADKPRVPLMIVLHGGGGTGERMERLTLGGFNTLADREGFVVVYPDGIEKHWNDGRGKVRYRTHREKIDDVGFLSALIDRLVQTRGIDATRVYVTGISNGAMMSNRLACELTDRIAGIAPVAGNMPKDLIAHCAPARPISVVMISGEDDTMMPWKGGEAHFRSLKFGEVVSAAATMEFWAAHNGCSPTPVVTQEPDKDPRDGTRVRKEVYGGCKAGTEVMLYAIKGGGHTWPGGHQYLPERIIGRTGRDIDANGVVWDFLKRQNRK